MILDFHVHMLDEQVVAATTNKTVFSGFGAVPTDEPRPGARRLLERMKKPEALIEDMDERGIDVAVVTSSTVVQGTSWADAKTDLELCRRCNATLAEWEAKYPKRIIASAVLPLQAPDLALKELDRRVRVINAGTSYNGVYLGDPRYHSFWEAVNEIGAAVWIHPEGIRDPWFQRYALWNSLGQSIEETKAMASLIYEGVMHRFPQLKVVIAHGGGYFPHYMGRLDRNHANRPDTVNNMGGKKPSEFLRSFYYDSCVYDPQVFDVLVDRVGPDRLIMGSDYPVGEKDPVGWIKARGLSAAEVAAICGGTAARLLDLA